MTKIIALFLLLTTLNSCYRMPTDQDYCLVPNVNNPDITREKNNSPSPSMGF